jgi:hypothetical protein
MIGLTTRDAIRAAISNAYYEARNNWQTMETAADNATEGVVDVLDTLAEPLCRRICDLLGEPRVLVPGEVSALLAAALSERAS